jgi:hypothetical protein
MFVEDLQAQSVNALDFSLTKKKNSSDRVLRFPTQSPGQLTQTVADLLELTNQNVNQQLIQIFSIHSAKLERDNSLAIKALEFERQLAISNYNAKKTERLAYLTEQAQIARTIDLAIGSVSSYANIEINYENKVGNEHMNMSFSGIDTAYLRGYVALEKEIKLIQSRSVENFIPDLARIELVKSDLLKKKKRKKLEASLESTPVGTDQFVAVDYNVDTLVYKNNTKTSLILALSIVLGGMLGIFVLFMQKLLVKKD